MSNTGHLRPPTQKQTRYAFEQLKQQEDNLIENIFMAEKMLAHGLDWDSNPHHMSPIAHGITLNLMARLNKEGCHAQVFEISATLLELLCNTTLQGVYPDDIHLPYTRYYIHLPPSGIPTTCADETNRIINGIHVDRTSPSTDDILFTAIQWQPDSEQLLGTQGPFLHLFQLWRTSEQDFEDFVSGVPSDIPGARAATAIFRIVVQTALYLASPKADVEEVADERQERLRRTARRHANSRRGRRARKTLLTKYSQARVFAVGASLGQDPANDDQEAHPRQEHWVRGHWRHQPYGPLDVDADERPTRRIWIRPHKRGSTAANDDRPRVYEVKDSA